MHIVAIAVAVLWGYLLGSVPTGVIVGRVLTGKDVHRQGSTHTGGTNVARLAGWWAGALTGAVDVLLAVAAVAGAGSISANPWAVAAAGVMAVIGHNWSVFIGFAGGIGLSSLAGGLLYEAPTAALTTLVIAALTWFLLIKVVRLHRARATIGVMLAVGPLLWALGTPLPTVVMGTLGALVVIVKTLPDWNRVYPTRPRHDDTPVGSRA
jgi:glycerol-3-phosphate acyltransferase PlsY